MKFSAGQVAAMLGVAKAPKISKHAKLRFMVVTPNHLSFHMMIIQLDSDKGITQNYFASSPSRGLGASAGLLGCL